MNKFVRKASPLFFYLTFSFLAPAYSQEMIQENCLNDIGFKQIDSIKKVQAGNGFFLLKETTLSMRSHLERTVILPLKKGIFYQFVVVGEQSSKLLEIGMYDWNENEVFFQEKKNRHAGENSLYISCIPDTTGYYLIKILQVNRQEKMNLCGHILLFQKTKD
jgi:hypothetical protein